MKKNLLSFIGSICGLIGFVLLGAPYVKYGETGSQTKYSIASLMGISEYKASSPAPLSYNTSITPIGLLLLASFIAAFISLIIVIKGIVENKDKNIISLCFSVIPLFSIYYVFKLLNTISEAASSTLYSTRYTFGWGILILLILFGAYFISSLVGYIISLVNIKKSAYNKEFEELYKYKNYLMMVLLLKMSIMRIKKKC